MLFDGMSVRLVPPHRPSPGNGTRSLETSTRLDSQASPPSSPSRRGSDGQQPRSPSPPQADACTHCELEKVPGVAPVPQTHCAGSSSHPETSARSVPFGQAKSPTVGRPASPGQHARWPTPPQLVARTQVVMDEMPVGLVPPHRPLSGNGTRSLEISMRLDSQACPPSSASRRGSDGQQPRWPSPPQTDDCTHWVLEKVPAVAPVPQTHWSGSPLHPGTSARFEPFGQAKSPTVGRPASPGQHARCPGPPQPVG